MKKLIVAETKKLKKELLEFYIRQYKNNPLKRDNMSSLLSGVLFEKSVLSESTYLFPILIKQEEQIILTAVLAQSDRLSDYMQIAFLESPNYDQEAFDLLMERSVLLAKQRNCNKISGSLNIHVNYGLGYLYDGYDKPQSFGMAHNPPHIHRYFEAHDFEKIDLITFKKNMQDLDDLMPQATRDKVMDKYRVRTVNFARLKEESAIYTKINNNAFKNHLFYYERKAEEDYELFKDLRYLLKPENLLFVQKNGVDVGFMLWYPDFNQIMKQKESVGIKTVVKAKLGKKIDTFKVVEIGVVQEEQGRGAILALFEYCRMRTKGKYPYFESSWVIEANKKSKTLGDKWSDGISKSYAAYIKEL